MTIPEPEFEALESLVRESNTRTERDCQNYLSYANEILLPKTSANVASITEVRSHYGDTDFIVSGDVSDDVGTIKREAYIWELKAPQCFLFEYDNNLNRCRATMDFLKGENQLLHYFHQAKNDDLFRRRMGLDSMDRIKFGGIIIGVENRKLRNPKSLADEAKADIALEVRMRYLYQSNGIRVMTWDTVLNFVRPV